MFAIETGEPETEVHARPARITFNGITVYSEVVYDTDEHGHRTAAQAERNVSLLFVERLRQLLED
jgi:hypothetical protein